MTRFDQLEKAKIKLEAHSSPRNSNSLVHDQGALQHCMLSNTHHKSSGLTFAPRDNQILRRGLCECFVRRIYATSTKTDILSYLGKQARGAPGTYIIFFTKLKEGWGSERERNAQQY